MGDLLFSFTEWLRSTWLTEFTIWLMEQPYSMIIQVHFWVIPSIQAIHILAIGALFGSVLMVNLKVLGLVGGHRSFADTATRFFPWIRWAFITLLVTGLLLVIGEPIRELINPVFWIKMALIVIAVIISLRFNKKVAAVESSGGSVASLRGGAVLLIVLWCAIMAGGRWIAYAPV